MSEIHTTIDKPNVYSVSSSVQRIFYKLFDGSGYIKNDLPCKKSDASEAAAQESDLSISCGRHLYRWPELVYEPSKNRRRVPARRGPGACFDAERRQDGEELSRGRAFQAQLSMFPPLYRICHGAVTAQSPNLADFENVADSQALFF